MEKIKIILDADVIIHFSKGGWLYALPSIFKGYEYSILDTVYKEILNPIRNELDNQIHFLKNITLIPFNPRGEMLKEYAKLSSTLGKGESACMSYCKYNHDVIGSSNLPSVNFETFVSETVLLIMCGTDFSNCLKYRFVYGVVIKLLMGLKSFLLKMRQLEKTVPLK